MGIDGFGYKFLLFLHIVSVVMAFGVPISRTVDRQALRMGDVALYLIPVWGLGMVGMSDGVIKFSDAWISVSLVLWFAIVGITHGLVSPCRDRLAAADVGAEKGAGANRAALAQRLKIGATCVQVLSMVVVALMVWKPGA